jgi:chromosome segregation ATPase
MMKRHRKKRRVKQMREATGPSIIVAFSLLFSSCNQAEIDALRNQVDDMSAEAKNLQTEYERARDQRRDAETQTRELDSMSRRLTYLKDNEMRMTKEYQQTAAYKRRVEVAVAEQEKQILSWRNEMSRSLANVGIPMLSTNGTVLRDCSIEGITESGVLLRHAAGNTEVAISQLPQSLQDRLVDEAAIRNLSGIER